tara:strand:- start:29355 stop:30095 length:741 start_codon:yes stop_codon:yes gene_type:complete
MQPTLNHSTSGEFLFRWRSYLPLALVLILLPALPHHHDHFHNAILHYGFEFTCLLVSVFGLVIRALTIGFVPSGTSGRNTRAQVADSLNTTGVYSICRNPLYVGNFFMMLGVVMFAQSWSACLIFILAFWLYYERIIAAEERFLSKKFGDVYINYLQSVPQFLPKLTGWTRPNMNFSMRTVLRREYSSYFAMIASLCAMEFLGDLLSERQIELDPYWGTLLAFSAIVYFSLRTMKKKTHLLDVEGR